VPPAQDYDGAVSDLKRATELEPGDKGIAGAAARAAARSPGSFPRTAAFTGVSRAGCARAPALSVMLAFARTRRRGRCAEASVVPPCRPLRAAAEMARVKAVVEAEKKRERATYARMFG
jgi:hypothetical protein